LLLGHQAAKVLAFGRCPVPASSTMRCNASAFDPLRATNPPLGQAVPHPSVPWIARRFGHASTLSSVLPKFF